MTRRNFLARAGAGVLGASALVGAAPKAKPNFVFILVDDLGWADLGCYGSTYHESPNIDRLATQGLRFTDAYAACPVCSPTRASILTGKYTATVNLTDFIPGHWRPYAKLVVPKFNQNLPADEVTLPEALKAAGYTSACVGKWHLGGKGSQPADHGFDVVVPGAASRTDKQTSGLTDAGLKFIESHKDKPFFLYLSYHTVHIPLEARKELVEKYRAKLTPGQAPPQQCNPAYAAMIEALDENVGRVMAKLDELKLADNTVLIFFSDNGGLIKMYTGQGGVVTSNAPLRSEKGSLYEGGIRVPLVIRWPGIVPPRTLCNVPVSSVDFYPTMLELAGVRPDPKHAVDGASLVPLFEPVGTLKRDALYWHYPHYHHTAPCGAIRAGDWKLIEFFEDGALELYNLKRDIGEARNLAAAMPERAAELRKRLDDWRKAVNAQMPTPNPDHDPKRAGEWGRRASPAPKK
ncbi:MAG TPA: sulfatase [Planctomycetota bacterium]|nr:sulfatase [Planctomycetota bacterium]